MKNYYSFINGEYAVTNQTNYIPIENPATAKTIAHAFTASDSDLELAIKSAKQGFERWQAISPTERGKILGKVAKILYEKNEELAYLEVQDTGKPIKESLTDDALSGADCFNYYAGLTDKISGIQQKVDNGFFYTLKEPLGICLGIGAWNYPLQIACWKAAPCLAAGNSMIFKPSMLTPTTALKLAEIMLEAGVPKGVFNVILGDNDIGEKLVKHQDVAKISLTGSVPTGKKVMAAAGLQLKPTTMELGGKSPIIIFEDANLELAVETTALANFYNQGEVCSNGTRVFVHRKIYPQFIEKICAYAAKIKLGDPMDKNTEMGALISSSHMEKVLNYINLGIKEGAKLIFGGERVTIPNNPGYFVQPTIFTECTANMTIVKEEIFGPVMSIFIFDDTQQVIADANNSTYGLAAGIFTGNLALAHKVASLIQAGTCWINSYNRFPISMPFGGYKDSGIGRENGIEAINSYMQNKSVYIALD